MPDKRFHPAANIFPMMTHEQLQELANDIVKNGQSEAIIYYHGTVLDGRNRLLACELAGIAPNEVEIEGEIDPIAYVISANFHRRQMTTGQKAMCAAKLPAMSEGRPKETPQICGDYSAEQAASVFGVSTRIVEHGRKVLAEGATWLIALCESGKSVATACQFIAACGGPDEQTAEVAGKKDKWGAVREFLKSKSDDGTSKKTAAESDPKTDNQTGADASTFDQFQALWNEADEDGRAAISAFVRHYEASRPKREGRQGDTSESRITNGHPVPFEEQTTVAESVVHDLSPNELDELFRLLPTGSFRGHVGIESDPLQNVVVTHDGRNVTHAAGGSQSGPATQQRVVRAVLSVLRKEAVERLERKKSRANTPKVTP